ncbi:MAG TPA: UbiA family prenyltransferase [Terriglobales bacterium]|nr:UbiA family prenyltransferase [Terriglobales bacterium]
MTIALVGRRLTASGYIGRMRGYFAEMLPLPRHLLEAALIYLGIALFARDVHHVQPPLLSRYTVIGVWSVFSVWLILRLMDELKDRDIDRQLFPERPLPAGRVLEADIRLSLVAAIAVYLLASLAAGRAFWTALVVLGYMTLMFRLFFVPDLLRRSLMLSLVTHTPILPLMILQGFAIFAAESGLGLSGLAWSLVVPYVIMVWSVHAAWEFARKIRRPADETDYVTYSSVLGPARAVWLAAATQMVTVTAALYLFVVLRLSWPYLALVVFAFALMAWTYHRFLRTDDPRFRRLRPYAEVFALSVLAAQVGEFAWRLSGR